MNFNAALFPGWLRDHFQTLAVEILDKDGLLVFRSPPLARLIDSDAQPFGSSRRQLNIELDREIQGAIEKWLSFILSGAAARLHVFSGTIELPRRSGGSVPCRWRYLGIPEPEPEYHAIVFEPLDVSPPSAPEVLERRALQLEQALLEVRSVIDRFEPAGQEGDRSPPLDLAALTARERDVIRLLLSGASNEDIARRLHVSLHTVKSHAKAIFRKIGVGSRSELISRFVMRIDRVIQ